MSFRTIIEINHDYEHAIEANEAGFVERLTGYLRASLPGREDDLRRYGIRVIETVHHSTPRHVVIDGRKIDL